MNTDYLGILANIGAPTKWANSKPIASAKSIPREVLAWIFAHRLLYTQHAKAQLIQCILGLIGKDFGVVLPEIKNKSSLHLWALSERDKDKNAVRRGYNVIAGLCAGVDETIIADDFHDFIAWGNYFVGHGLLDIPHESAQEYSRELLQRHALFNPICLSAIQYIEQQPKQENNE